MSSLPLVTYHEREGEMAFGWYKHWSIDSSLTLTINKLIALEYSWNSASATDLTGQIESTQESFPCSDSHRRSNFNYGAKKAALIEKTKWEIHFKHRTTENLGGGIEQEIQHNDYTHETETQMNKGG